MESLHCLRFLLELKKILCKIDHNDAYFTIPLRKHSLKYVRFKWSGNLYEFFYLCFGLGPVQKVFNKLLNIPVSLLRRINIRIFVYLNDALLMRWSLQEIMKARDTYIFLLQNVGFVINLKKLILQPVKQLEFWDYRKIEKKWDCLSEEKLTHIIQ